MDVKIPEDVHETAFPNFVHDTTWRREWLLTDVLRPKPITQKCPITKWEKVLLTVIEVVSQISFRLFLIQ